MARPGIDYQLVANTAKALLVNGQSPTIENVRRALGTGSNSTIARHLAQFREENPGGLPTPTLEGLPESLVSVIKDLWNDLLQKSDEKMLAQEVQHQEAIELYKAEFASLREDNLRLQKLYDEMVLKNKTLYEAGCATEEALFTEQKEHDNLQVAYNLQEIKLTETQTRINELHQLHKQAQMNLEHFREASQKQTNEYQMRHEHQIQQLQNDIKQAQKIVSSMREENAKQRSQIQNAKDQLQIVEHENIRHLQGAEELRTQIQFLNVELNALKNDRIELQTQAALLTQQLTDKTRLNSELDKIYQSLLQEKMTLIQEKSHLQGRLRQLEILENSKSLEHS